MARRPWLTLIGVGEDGLAGLPDYSREAIARAERIFGGKRHLALVGAGERGEAWPTPFDIAPVLAWRGRPVVVLASGDPFWYGVGGTLAAHLGPEEWVAYPAPSTFSFAAARLGWRLEETVCLGLHAQPLSELRRWLRRGARLIVLVRDETSLKAAAALACQEGFGKSRGWVLQRLGGPAEQVIPFPLADHAALPPLQAPLALAFALDEGPAGLPATPGLPDAAFLHDGQITKAPMRALTLAALAPRPGEWLWDLGAGSGSISVEWCLAGGYAHAVEWRTDRAERIAQNSERFGVASRLQVHQGENKTVIGTLPRPDAVFVGGGFDESLFAALRRTLPTGCRLVVNAVTLATTALLHQLYEALGGELWQFTLTQAQPLGPGHAWQPVRPWVQWRWEIFR